MLKQLTLYRELTAIAEDYLGPAAPRFISRIIENHLHKGPEEVVPEDMPQIITWVRLSISLVTDREEDIAEFTDRLSKLGTPTTA